MGLKWKRKLKLEEVPAPEQTPELKEPKHLDALHFFLIDGYGDKFCAVCGTEWPCATVEQGEKTKPVAGKITAKGKELLITGGIGAPPLSHGAILASNPIADINRWGEILATPRPVVLGGGGGSGGRAAVRGGGGGGSSYHGASGGWSSGAVRMFEDEWNKVMSELVGKDAYDKALDEAEALKERIADLEASHAEVVQLAASRRVRIKQLEKIIEGMSS